MGSQWLLLLLLIWDGAIHLPGHVTVWGVGSVILPSTDSVPTNLKTAAFSSTSSPLSTLANKRPTGSTAVLSSSSATLMTSVAGFPESTSASPSTSQASNMTGSTEQTAQVGGIQERKSQTTLPTPSKDTILSTSMTASPLKDQGGTSRTTASFSMATSAETPEVDQGASAAASSASSKVNGLEPSVKTATTTAPTTLSITNDMKESLSTATSVKPVPVNLTTSLTITMLETTVLETTMSAIQEGLTTDAPPAPTTDFAGSDMNCSAHTMSKVSETHHSTVSQILSSSADSASSASIATGQSPETTAAHPAALSPTSSGTTKSSAMAGASQASPKHTQSNSLGACALDEYPTSVGGCMCNDSYYAHSELSVVLVALHCGLQEIEVVLSSCFLKTRHWNLRDGAFSGCPNVSKMEQGRRGQAFMVEKKEGTCGLCLSTNSSHALYSLEVQLLHSPGFTSTDSRTVNFSCTYPLVVNASQSHPQPVVSFVYNTIHMPGIGDTVVILGIFKDPQFLYPLDNKTTPLGMPLYVVLRATSSDPDRFALVANEVFASTDISRMGANTAIHRFVTKSCPVSPRLLEGVRDNGISLEVTLAFNLFRFLSSDTLYLHGRVTLCDMQAGRSCQPSCSPESPRDRHRAWASRAQERLEGGDSWLVYGPIRIKESSASSIRSPGGAWTAFLLLMVIGWMLG